MHVSCDMTDCCACNNLAHCLLCTGHILLCIAFTILCNLMCNMLCIMQIVPLCIILNNLHQHYPSQYWTIFEVFRARSYRTEWTKHNLQAESLVPKIELHHKSGQLFICIYFESVAQVLHFLVWQHSHLCFIWYKIGLFGCVRIVYNW